MSSSNKFPLLSLLFGREIFDILSSPTLASTLPTPWENVAFVRPPRHHIDRSSGRLFRKCHSPYPTAPRDQVCMLQRTPRRLRVPQSFPLPATVFGDLHGKTVECMDGAGAAGPPHLDAHIGRFTAYALFLQHGGIRPAFV